MNEFGQLRRVYRHFREFVIEILSIASANWAIMGEKFVSIRVCPLYMNLPQNNCFT